MPTLGNPSGRLRIPLPLTGASGSTPVAHADKIRSELDPSTTGNTVEDHLEDLIARSGHSVAAAYATGIAYEIGDEVFWVDADSNKRFFLRLTNGTDAANSNPTLLPADWREIANNLSSVPVIGANQNTLQALLVRATNGAIDFSTVPTADIQARQTADQVNALINAQVLRLASTTRWRGLWAAGTHIIYEINDYVTVSGGAVYRRHDHRGHDAANEDPANNSDDWIEVTGTERLVAFRLRDVFNLLDWSIQLEKSQTDRGHWIQRSPSDESHTYAVPPMCWGDAWNDTTRYYYGNVVTHSNRLWVLTPISTITSPKHGAGTVPGTDADWEEIAIGSGHVNWRGSWADIGFGTAIRVGDIVEHTGFYYICEIAHNRPSGGPDTQPDNYTVLNNWGGNWTNRYYHSGIFVTHAERVWLSEADVVPSEPEPGADNNSKWVEVGSTRVNPDSDFNVSPTIGTDNQNRAVLESPGANGLWAEPSTFPRGLPVDSGITIASSRPTALGAESRLRILGLSSELSQFLSLTESVGVITFNLPPHELNFRISGEFIAPLAGSQVRLRVHFEPFDAAGGYVYTLDPTIPGATTALNPFQFNDVVDFSGYTLRKGDRLRVEYTRRSGSASDAAILAAIRDVRIRVDINGVPIRADAYDTGPVQSRPLRDIISHDVTEEVAVAYRGAVADWNHNEVISPLRYPQGSGVGDGWEIQESSRGAGGASAGEREIRILSAGLYDVDFRGGMRFQDRTTGQSQADDVIMELLHIPAAHASDKNRFPSNNDLTVLSQKRVYDIARIEGDVPFSFNGTGRWRYLIPTVPTVLDDRGDHRYVQYWNTVTRNLHGNMQRPQIRVLPGYYRYQIIFEAVFIGDPGTGSIFSTRVRDAGREVYRWLPHNGTQQNPVTLTWRFADTDGGQEQGNDGTGGYTPSSDDVLECWFGLTRPSSQTFDWSAIRSAKLTFRVWINDNDHSEFDLAASAQTFAANDVVAFRARNDSQFGGSRVLHAAGIHLTVANNADVSGRHISVNGAASGENINLANVADTEWFRTEGGYLVARRDMRRIAFSMALTAPGTGRHAQIWRRLPGFTSMELVIEQRLGSGGNTLDATASGVVAGEEFVFRVTGGSITGNAQITAEAQTPTDAPQKQVRLEGLHRPTRVVDEDPFPVTLNWKRLPLLGGARWSTYPVLRLYAQTGRGHWGALTPIDTELFQEIGTNQASGDGSILGSTLGGSHTRVRVTPVHQSDYGLFVAPLSDGGLAIVANNNNVSVSGIKGWGE